MWRKNRRICTHLGKGGGAETGLPRLRQRKDDPVFRTDQRAGHQGAGRAFRLHPPIRLLWIKDMSMAGKIIIYGADACPVNHAPVGEPNKKDASILMLFIVLSKPGI
jgi:hypothetical protein